MRTVRFPASGAKGNSEGRNSPDQGDGRDARRGQTQTRPGTRTRECRIPPETSADAVPRQGQTHWGYTVPESRAQRPAHRTVTQGCQSRASSPSAPPLPPPRAGPEVCGVVTSVSGVWAEERDLGNLEGAVRAIFRWILWELVLLLLTQGL